MVPVYNEALHLAARITELRTFLDKAFPFSALVTVVDNASTDRTFEVATELAHTLPGVAAMHLSRKGRGLALRTAWSTSSAPVVAYMDVDLSTSLTALLPLVAPLLSGHGDVAIGSRLARGAHVIRGPDRELISRSCNLLLKCLLHGGFSDAQCGFKALRADAARQLLPLVEDDAWFFDTELLVTAQRMGLRISEVPVDWVDDPDSRVQIVKTALDDLRGVWRMVHRRHQAGRSVVPVDRRPVATDQLLRFAGVGVVSTLGYLLLFVAWRPLAGTLGANALALAICTLFNTAVHHGARPRRQPAPAPPWSLGGGRHREPGRQPRSDHPRPAGGRPDLPDFARPRTGRRHRGQRRRGRAPFRRPARLGLRPGRTDRLRGGVVMIDPTPPSRGGGVALLDPPISVHAGGEAGVAETLAPPARRRGRAAGFVRGKESDPVWVRPALLTLLTLTAVLYLWDLGASGWANSFYSAAVQAGTKSWKAFFFGSSDSSNFITVDKPPAFLWPMEISARIFGLNAWSTLAPQALEGVATVGLVYLSVRRWFSAQAALLAGAVLALTPVAAMMFRYNNPERCSRCC